MFELSKLLQPLPPGPARELEPTDPRVGDLAQVADRREAEETRRLAQALLEEGYLDVRALTCWMWAAFALEGPSSLGPSFETLAAAATLNFEHLSPVRRRPEHLLRRAAWLCQRVSEGLAYHEQKNTTDWSRWKARLSPGDMTRALEALDVLDAALYPLGSLASSSVAQLMVQLRQVGRTLDAPVVSSPPASASPSASAPIAGGAEATPLPSPVDAAGAALGNSGAPLVGLGPSHHFFELLAKLDAFRLLVERREWTKAAIVSDDLSQLIDSFDPRLYFPALFSDYSEALSAHVSELSEEWSQRDSLAWKTASQFYRVDLRRFVGS